MLTQVLGLEDNQDGYLNKGMVISVGLYALYLFEVALHSCSAHHQHAHHRLSVCTHAEHVYAHDIR